MRRNHSLLTAFPQTRDSASPTPDDIKGINKEAVGKGVMRMPSAALAAARSRTGVPGSWPAWTQSHHPLLVQVARYMMVGGLGTAVILER